MTLFNRYYISNAPFTANDYSVLTTNDEFHYEEQHVYFWGGVPIQYKTKIFSDTTVGTLRTLSFKNTWNSNRPPFNNNNCDTTYFPFDINEIKYDKKSMVVDDTNITNKDGIVQILFESTTPQLNNLFLFEKLYYVAASQNSPKLNSIYLKTLPTYSTERSIGYPEGYFHSYYYVSQLRVHFFRLDYIKKGNQTWGSPYNFTVGLEENSANDNSIQLYPNPVKDVLNINTSSQLQRVRIFTIDGKLQLESKNSRNIDVSNFQAGLYLIEISTDNGVVTKRLIKE